MNVYQQIKHKDITITDLLQWIYLSCFTLFSFNGITQNSDTMSNISWSAYLETYFGFDTPGHASNERPLYFYSFHRSNEVQVNIALVSAQLQRERLRANIGIMTGSYAKRNLAHEPFIFQFVHDANVGIQLTEKKDFWLDVGVLPSHIGFEGTIGQDFFNLTRSFAADNSPYYNGGAQLSYATNNEKWYFALLYLNGWQRIQRLKGSSVQNIGHQVQYQPNDSWLFNSSSFIGSDSPDSIGLQKIFHNFYLSYQGKRKWNFIAGFDFGLAHNDTISHPWFSPILNAQFNASERLRFGMRAEYFEDGANIILRSTEPLASVLSWTFNWDIVLKSKAMWRTEIKQLLPNFFENGSFSSANPTFLFTTGLSIVF